MGILDGQVAIVTGASRGIGKVIAEVLAEEGAFVLICARDEAKLKNALESMISSGRRVIGRCVDVADAGAVQGMVDACLNEFNRLDILVNNAGIARDSLLARMSSEDWGTVLGVNLTGVYNCTKASLRPMLKQRSGRIINIASVVGIMGNPGQANYVAAKAGVIGFTKAVARELASRGITVNAVAPGFIETDMTAAMAQKTRDEILKQVPMERFGTPAEVANCVKFLASSEASYITGQVIHVNGGMLMP